MLITSSRKPSAGTRTLCKHLASFFGCEYFNRGKMGMGEVLSLSHGKPLLIVGEYHGNPGSMVFYDHEGYCVLSLHISVLSAPSSHTRHSGSIVSIDGDCELAHAICDLLFREKANDVSPLSMAIAGDRIDFKEDGNDLFSLRIKSHRLYDGDSDCN
ncbi:rRNA maturation protein [Methanolobus sp. WCC5]|jgi:U3 small nucleolar ribonucleoprotein protein IMP4|uniref:rRNA maturation protein n=1 Tax=Methanolobus sp. WCC5 TaxID=3125785 RepID=UPI00324A7F33